MKNVKREDLQELALEHQLMEHNDMCTWMYQLLETAWCVYYRCEGDRKLFEQTFDDEFAKISSGGRHHA